MNTALRIVRYEDYFNVFEKKINEFEDSSKTNEREGCLPGTQII